jgi:hypothetical protein
MNMDVSGTAGLNKEGVCTRWMKETAQNTPLLCCCIHCCVQSHLRGPHGKRRFPASSLAHVRNKLPSNGRCLQSHYSATRLHAALCMYVYIFIILFLCMFRRSVDYHQVGQVNFVSTESDKFA